jgi:hypothetical protein
VLNTAAHEHPDAGTIEFLSNGCGAEGEQQKTEKRFHHSDSL